MVAGWRNADVLDVPRPYYAGSLVVEYVDWLEHALTIPVILQVACALAALAHPSHLLE